MNRRVFVSSIAAAAIGSATVPYGLDAEALARTQASGRRIMVRRGGEWLSVLNLSFVKPGEVIHGCDRLTGEILPVGHDVDYRYAKICEPPYYLKDNGCFGAEVDVFATAEEALA